MYTILVVVSTNNGVLVFYHVFKIISWHKIIKFIFNGFLTFSLPFPLCVICELLEWYVVLGIIIQSNLEVQITIIILYAIIIVLGIILY